MCGRYSLTRSIKKIAEHFGVKPIFWDAPPRFNVAPTQILPVIAAGSDGWQLQPMRWGLIPHWAKTPDIGNRLINARAETVSEKPSFRTSFKTRRCLVPCDGFYEWRPGENGKVPFHIRMKSQELFALAGLWAEWSGETSPLLSYTIITTRANHWLAPLHERMPVILNPEDYASWLNSESPPDTLQSLLRPLGKDLLEYFEVSRRVNSPKNDDAHCAEPVK